MADTKDNGGAIAEGERPVLTPIIWSSAFSCRFIRETAQKVVQSHPSLFEARTGPASFLAKSVEGILGRGRAEWVISSFRRKILGSFFNLDLLEK